MSEHPTIVAMRRLTLPVLDRLDDQALLELHTVIMGLRHRVVMVQRHRRERERGEV
jgi:hypothetical protein